MLSKLVFGVFMAMGLFFAPASLFAAEVGGGDSEEAEGAESEGESGEAEAGAAGTEAAGAGEAGAGSSVVPTEVQQQLDSTQKTIDDTAKQVQSVKEKGLLQTIWDNITAPFIAIFQQIGQMLSQIFSIFGTK
jgi:hypothetical protein